MVVKSLNDSSNIMQEWFNYFKVLTDLFYPHPVVWLRTHYVLTAEDRKADHVIAVTGSGVLGDWLSEKCHISMEYPPKSCKFERLNGQQKPEQKRSYSETLLRMF